MKTYVDFNEVYTLMGRYLITFISGGFSAGLLLGTAMEFLGYGVFKAMSLLNIKT